MNKPRIISRMFALELCLAALNAVSCDDERKYDVVELKGSRVYVNRGVTDGIRNLMGAAGIIHTPVSKIGNDTSVFFADAAMGAQSVLLCGSVEASPQLLHGAGRIQYL